MQGYAKDPWRQKDAIGSLDKLKFSRIEDFGGNKQTTKKNYYMSAALAS